MSVSRPIPAIPSDLAALIPAACLQIVVVSADDEKATDARLWMLERDLGTAWKPVDGPLPARIGRNGLAWGMEGPARGKVAVSRIKREGDGCSPVGVFGIPTAFGAATAPHGLKLPYVRCTQHHFGIDDVRSRFYNQIVDAREVTCDWTSPETMIPPSGCYELGAVIAHNPGNIPGAGSCIFFHVWQGQRTPTSGCTALSLENMRHLLEWLDEGKAPHVVQFVKE